MSYEENERCIEASEHCSEYVESFYGLKYDNKTLSNENYILRGRLKDVANERDKALSLLKESVSLMQIIECSGHCKKCHKCNFLKDPFLRNWGIITTPNKQQRSNK